MKRPWTLPTLLVLCGLVAATGPFREGDPGIGAAVVAAFAVLAALNSPLIHPRSISASEAAQRSERDGLPIVYWRPGCAYCLRLRLRLGRGARRLHWVDIWRDPDGAAAVRAANGGDETVPTVIVSGRPYVNPDPAWVRDQLSPSA
ncbi:MULTISPECIES: glutaredoxin domain-containing protein [Streptomyces]|uniref:glutaredoxin domain-containing protein n=1 Tax=Streptomyces TaxID=1883 RepID=UPI00109D2C37|nr:glutaredoxin domain-containing protein [Streptomyces sp. S816]TGZ14823.1 membrane protein [Streptomyces sp. S816]